MAVIIATSSPAGGTTFNGQGRAIVTANTIGPQGPPGDGVATEDFVILKTGSGTRAKIELDEDAVTGELSLIITKL